MPPGEFCAQFEKGPDRVNRGGSWNNTADNARAANRGRNFPGFRDLNVGFRLCCDADYPEHTQRSEHAQEV
jgi:formylglycine-generating enzyme required for sulfatase activity